MGSPVPVQSKPRWKRERSVRSVLAACETTSGRSPARRSARTWRTPEPLGAHSHLCPLPVQYAAPRAARSTGTIPGACAPSTSVSTPLRSSSRTSAATGITRAVGDVTWLTSARRVRGVTASRNASTTCDWSRDRERHPDDDDGRAIPLGRRPEGVERGVVLVIAGEELVAGAEAPRCQDRGDAGGGVGDEREAVRVRAQEGGDIAAGVIEMPLQLAVEEADRLALQAVAPGPLGLEDGLRTRPERPVVEEGDVRLQEPRRAIEGAGGHAATLAQRTHGRGAVPRIRGVPAPRP